MPTGRSVRVVRALLCAAAIAFLAGACRRREITEGAEGGLQPSVAAEAASPSARKPRTGSAPQPPEATIEVARPIPVGVVARAAARLREACGGADWFDPYVAGPFVVYVHRSPSAVSRVVADTTLRPLLAMEDDFRRRFGPLGVPAVERCAPLLIYRSSAPPRILAPPPDVSNEALELRRSADAGSFELVDDDASFPERMRRLATFVYDNRLNRRFNYPLKGAELWPTRWLRVGWSAWYAGAGRTRRDGLWTFDFGRLPQFRLGWLDPTDPPLLEEEATAIERDQLGGEDPFFVRPEPRRAVADLARLVSDDPEEEPHPAIARDLVDFLLFFDRDDAWRFRFVKRGKYADRFESFTAAGFREALDAKRFRSHFGLDDETFAVMNREFQAYGEWLRFKLSRRHVRDGRPIPAHEYRTKRGAATGRPEDDDLVRTPPAKDEPEDR